MNNNESKPDPNINYCKYAMIKKLNGLIHCDQKLQGEGAKKLNQDGTVDSGLVMLYMISEELLTRLLILVNHCDKYGIDAPISIAGKNYRDDQTRQQLALLSRTVHEFQYLTCSSYADFRQSPCISSTTVTELNNELKENKEDRINELSQWKKENMPQYVSSLSGSFSSAKLTALLIEIFELTPSIFITNISSAMAIKKHGSKIIFYPPDYQDFKREFNNVSQLVAYLFQQPSIFPITTDGDGIKNITMCLKVFNLKENSNIARVGSLFNKYFHDHFRVFAKQPGILYTLTDEHAPIVNQIVDEIKESDQEYENLIANTILASNNNPMSVRLLSSLLTDDKYKSRGAVVRKLLDQPGKIASLGDFIFNNQIPPNHPKYGKIFLSAVNAQRDVLDLMFELAIKHNDAKAIGDFFTKLSEYDDNQNLFEALKSVDRTTVINMIDKFKDHREVTKFLTIDSKIAKAVADNMAGCNINYSQRKLQISLNKLIDDNPELANVTKLPNVGACSGFSLVYGIAPDLFKRLHILVNHCDKHGIHKPVSIAGKKYEGQAIIKQLRRLSRAVTEFQSLQTLCYYDNLELCSSISGKTVKSLNEELQQNGHKPINKLHLWHKKDMREQFCGISGSFPRCDLEALIDEVLARNNVINVGNHTHSMLIRKHQHQSKYIFFDPNNPDLPKPFDSPRELVNYLIKQTSLFPVTTDDHGKKHIALSLKVLNLKKNSNIDEINQLFRCYIKNNLSHMAQNAGILLILRDMDSPMADKILNRLAQGEEKYKQLILGSLFSMKNNPLGLAVLGYFLGAYSAILNDGLCQRILKKLMAQSFEYKTYRPRIKILKKLLRNQPKIITKLGSLIIANRLSVTDRDYHSKNSRCKSHIVHILHFMFKLAIKQNNPVEIVNFLKRASLAGCHNDIMIATVLELVDRDILYKMIDKFEDNTRLTKFLKSNNKISNAIRGNMTPMLTNWLSQNNYSFAKIPLVYADVVNKHIKEKIIQVLRVDPNQRDHATIYDGDQFKQILKLVRYLKKIRQSNIVDSGLKNVIQIMKLFVFYIKSNDNNNKLHCRHHFWGEAPSNPKLIDITKQYMNRLAAKLQEGVEINHKQFIQTWYQSLLKTPGFKASKLEKAFRKAGRSELKMKDLDDPDQNNTDNHIASIKP